MIRVITILVTVVALGVSAAPASAGANETHRNDFFNEASGLSGNAQVPNGSSAKRSKKRSSSLVMYNPAGEPVARYHLW